MNVFYMDFESTSGEKQRAGCAIEDETYPSGHVRCSDGRCVTCDNGSWSDDNRFEAERAHGRL